MYVRHRTKFLLLKYWIFTMKNEFFASKKLKFNKNVFADFCRKLGNETQRKKSATEIRRKETIGGDDIKPMITKPEGKI